MNYKLTNILLTDTPQFLSAPGLVCRSDARRWANDTGEMVLGGPGKHDFTTFFNAVSVGKLHRYTRIDNIWLHIELKGAACTVLQTRADALSYATEYIEGETHDVAASDDWQDLDIEMANRTCDVLESVELDVTGDVCVRNAFFYTKVDRSALRNVELALCTTTFKKEAYIQHNIESIRTEILGSDDPIAQHFQMHVVDNGRTLDAEALTRDGITVHPNDNVGGAGGYARGMIEAMEQTPRATHVLLMDDDVVVSPESIKRTYTLLTLVNDEYADAFVSGAMMAMNEPSLRWEDMGYVGWDGAFHPLKPAVYMDQLAYAVQNETFEIPSDVRGLEDQAQHYAAWWYCVIPMAQIDKNGLPLPIFVRGDDVEYSRRCKPKFMTMNGICIWHEAFHLRYNAAQERYQMTRNCFIDQYASNFAPMSDIESYTRLVLRLELKKYNYADAELLIQGFEDFLKGPEWIMQPVAQKAFMDANRNAEKRLPFAEMADECARLGVDLSKVTSWNIEYDPVRSRKDNAILSLSLNGQLNNQGFTERGKVAVIDAKGWSDRYGRFMKAETIVAVDMPQHRVAIRHKDAERCKQLWRRYQADVKEFKAHKEDLRASYSAAFPKMTSVEFWKGYLGI